MKTLRETLSDRLDDVVVRVQNPKELSLPERLDIFKREANLLLEKVIRAFGNCEKCYGKGYGTETVFASSSRHIEKMPSMNFCDCPRGVALGDLIEKEL